MTISRSESFQRDQWRLSTALVISAIIHALLLSITLGGQTFGLPALKFPWLDRRLGATDLQVLLERPVAARPASTPPPLPSTAQTVNANPVLAPVERPAAASPVASITSPPPAIGNSEAPAVLIPPPPPAPAPVPMPSPESKAEKRADVPLPISPVAEPVNAPANSLVRNIPIQEREAPVPDSASDIAQKQLEKESREHALEEAKLEQEKQAAERLRQAELMADAQRQAARQEQQRQEAARQEQERVEAARKETLRQEQVRQAQLEAARQEQLRQEAARAEQARIEAARQESDRVAQARQEELRREQARLEEKARQEAARQAQERAEIARVEAARKEALRQEQAKQAQLEAARQDAIKQEAARQEAAKQEAARLEQTKREQAQLEKAKQEAEHEERLKAIGRQLNEEAAQRDAALKNPSKSLLPSASGLRRGWLFGRADPNIDLVQYAEAMSKKFELNMAFDLVREAVKQRHVPPMVTVAIRADGSVEKVTFVVSSGVPAIDDAIRKVVSTYAPYGAFPPALARQYDVIEIRRTWVFDTAIRLQ
jgi:hypothetical protein